MIQHGPNQTSWHLWPFCALALLLLFSSVSFATGFALRVHPLYLENEGRDDVTRAVVRDDAGYLWVATDNGLKRYDGYRFKVYGAHPKDGLADRNNAINDILVDDKGLWLAGANLGYFSLTGETLSRYEISHGPSLNALLQDRDGMLWVGGEGTGLIGFDPEARAVFRRVFERQPMGHIRRLALSQTPNKIWVASSAGLYRYDTQQNTYDAIDLPLDYGVGLEAIRDLTEDRSGQLWVASDSGAFRVDPSTGKYVHYQADPSDPTALATNRLWSVFCDSRGSIWLGTDKMGVHKYDSERDAFVHIPASTTDPDSFPLGSILRIYEDSFGSLWFATGQFGVFRISEHLNKFYVLRHSHDTPNSLSFDNVLDLHEDADGHIWIATDGRGVDRFNPETGEFQHFRHDPNDPTSLVSDSAVALAEDDQQRIWVGTWEGGISIIDTENNRIKNLRRDPSLSANKTLANNNIFRLEFTANDKLFISVHMIGLQILDLQTGEFEVYSGHEANRFNAMKNDTLNDFLILDNGDAWLGGFQALEYYNADSKTITASELTVSEGIMDIFMDKAGMLWIATRQRLIRFNPQSGDSKDYLPRHGLADNYVVSIAQDDNGFLWLGTRNGLNRFDPQTEKFWRYGRADGIAGNQFNRFSQLKTRSGKMYFGGTSGITIFDPHDLPYNKTPPVTHITEIELGLDRGQDDFDRLIDKPVSRIDELILPYSHRDVAFEFAALSFLAPLQNRYRYRLKGLEQSWHEVGADRRYARYTNLAPGEYTFEVYGSNNDGVWAEAPTSIALSVLPAWWQTRWALLGYFLLVITLLYLYGFWRSYKNRRREKYLKVRVDEQTTALRTAYQEIYKLNEALEERVAHRTKELLNEVEERKQSEQRAHYIAFHDSLTELYNRTWLLQRIKELIDNRQADDKCFAIIAIGLDRFRRINEVYGHKTGDMVLVSVAQRLIRLAESEFENSVRSGSDEFVFIVDRIKAIDEAHRVANGIMEIFQDPIVSGNVSLSISASLGVVVCDSSYIDANQVMRCANVAMQKAKELGRGQYQFFDELMLKKVTEEAELDADLKQALSREQFSVVFQPIVDTRSRRVWCFETLIRWLHPEKGMIPPSDFIPMAESNGQIYEIGLWVLSEACKQLQKWNTLDGIKMSPSISVNLSPIQLEQPEFSNKVQEVLQRYSITPSSIRFEITETAIMQHSDEVDHCLFALRALGVQFAIDDFGTGYSSLSYLDRLPVQILKMDRCFISALDGDEKSSASAKEIVRASISLAHSLEMTVVGEGVETQEQLSFLASYGCEYAQGYLIARPLKPEDATVFLLSYQSQDG